MIPFSEPRSKSLIFEHSHIKEQNDALIGARYTLPNAAIWLVRDPCPKRSDWCEQYTDDIEFENK